MPIPDWELWACLQQHGTQAADHIEQRVMALAQAGDEEGVRTWLAIAGRVDELADVEGRGRARNWWVDSAYNRRSVPTDWLRIKAVGQSCSHQFSSSRIQSAASASGRVLVWSVRG